MQAIVKIVSELFMLVLSVVSAPSDLKEFRLDVIQQSGHVESMLVRRTDTGFLLLEQQGDKTIERGTIRPVEGKPATYSLKLGNAPKQTIDLAAGIQGFTAQELQKSKSLDLKTGDGVVIHVSRSGSAVYLTPEKGQMTYACHGDSAPSQLTPLSFRDADSGMVFLVESDRHHVVAVDKDGKLLWCRQPATDGKLPPYSDTHPQPNPRITWIGSATVPRPNSVGISFSSRQAGALDLKTGDFTFLGQD